jgi:putative hemolysin
MQQLISVNDFSKAIGTDKLKINKVNNYLLKLLKLNEINNLYSSQYDENGITFINQLLEEINVHLKFDAAELKNIPSDGAFISISNHPFGAIDGLILLKLLIERRADAKIIGNFLLTQIQPLAPHVFPVNPFGNTVKKSSHSGIKLGMEHLKNGMPVGIFPAGEVSTIQNLKTIADKEWKPSMIKFIRNSNVPVVPIYFHGSNSIAFHLLGLINPALRTLKLPSELTNKRNKTIEIRIGKPIMPSESLDLMSTTQYGKYLRAKTYALGSSLEVKKFFIPQSLPLKRNLEIIPPVKEIVLMNEVQNIPQHKLFEWGDYQIYAAPTKSIPNVIQEIGRLREKTFRSIGEGTGKNIDIDEYDVYYDQLFIWDKKELEIVGGYRIGKGKEIHYRYGKKGFYLNSLFKFKKGFESTLAESIELGRSFVTEKYQKKAFPLFCLWKGIMTYLVKHPEYRYVIGPVSISNQYSKLSKNLIIDFLKTNHYDFEKSKQIKPRKQYKTNYKSQDYRMFLETADFDLNKLDKIIEEIEPGRFKIPVLFRKYLEQNAKIIGFNRDPKFNNSLDGLMILDVNNIPVRTIQTLTKDKKEYFNILNRFYGQYVHQYESIPQF